MKHPSLQPEDCWKEGGQLGLEVSEDGSRVRIRGNHDGLVGLARVLLWLAQYRAGADEVLSLDGFAEFEDGPRLELRAPQ